MASYQPAWAPVQPQRSEQIPDATPQRLTGIAPSTVLGIAAMAAVGATGAIGLAAPASAATNDPGSSAKGTLIAQEHAQTSPFARTMTANSTAANATDPGTALAERIRIQAAQQRATADDAARRQAAQVAAAKQARALQAVAEAAAAAQAAQDARDAGLRLGELVAPVAGAVTGSGFGQSDSYWAHLHTGQDFAAPSGAPVVAIGNGTVTSAGWAGAFGYRVVETLPDGTEVWYCHLSAIGVGSGEVTAGQPIGRVGATGNVTAPHLHLEVRPGGAEPVDPAAWLAEHGLSL